MARKIVSMQDAAAFLHHCFLYPEEEFMHILFLRKDGTVLDRLMSEGSHDRVGVNLRSIFWRAMECDASRILIAHNHPSGIAQPSANDRKITRQMASVGKSLDVGLMDHLIYANGDWFSFRQAGLL